MSIHTIFFVLGGPGSGKGTICSELVRRYEFIHLSLGDVIRKYMLDNPQSDDTIRYKDTLTNGCCIPASESIKFLMSATNNMYQNDKTPRKILIDGYPRSLEQLEAYNKNSPFPLSINSDKVYLIWIDTPKHIMTERMMSRKRDFRDEDINIIQKRFTYFENETVPVFNKLMSDIPERIIKVDGQLPPSHLSEYIMTSIQNQ